MFWSENELSLLPSGNRIHKVIPWVISIWHIFDLLLIWMICSYWLRKYPPSYTLIWNRLFTKRYSEFTLLKVVTCFNESLISAVNKLKHRDDMRWDVFKPFHSHLFYGSHSKALVHYAKTEMCVKVQKLYSLYSSKRCDN